MRAQSTDRLVRVDLRYSARLRPACQLQLRPRRPFKPTGGAQPTHKRMTPSRAARMIT